MTTTQRSPARQHWASYHVHFDHKPVIEGHVCEAVKGIGSVLRCPEGDTDIATGNCQHVQIRPCDCPSLVRCQAHDADAESQLDIEVQRELADGNWPACFSCKRVDQVSYMGICEGSPTFVCFRCSSVFAMNLGDEE